MLSSQERSDASSRGGTPVKKKPEDNSSSAIPSLTSVQSLYASAGIHIASSSQARVARPAGIQVEVLSSDEEDVVELPTTENPAAGKPWFDATRGCMVRGIPGEAGAVEEAVMQPGDHGFLMASVEGDSEFETEVPNSLISLAKAGKPSHAVSKAKAKAKGKAKAKAKAKASSSASAKAVAKSKAKAKAKAKASAKAAVVKNDDCVFERYYYTKSGACGIRQKLPERYQMFQFGNSSVTKSDLYEIADQCIQRMLANDLAKEDAKDWCTQRFHSLNQG